jgi:hypothetical protein
MRALYVLAVVLAAGVLVVVVRGLARGLSLARAARRRREAVDALYREPSLSAARFLELVRLEPRVYGPDQTAAWEAAADAIARGVGLSREEALAMPVDEFVRHWESAERLEHLPEPPPYGVQ